MEKRVVVLDLDSVAEGLNWLARASFAIPVITVRDVVNARVYGVFRALAPLAEEPVRVTRSLVVGEWIKYKGYSLPERDVVPVIKKYGEKIAAVVREDIREEFSELVRLTRKLRNMPKRVSVRVPCVKVAHVDVFDYRASVAEYIVHAVSVDAEAPRTFVLHTDAGKRRFIVAHAESLIVTAQLMPYIVKAYKTYLEAVERTRKHNMAVLDKMREVAAPYLATQIF